MFGADYRDSFFAAMFNLRKVTRHVLEPDGATFKTRDTDFLVSDNRDFHPTDVLEDADGSLVVVDTGPWYKLCCPTSQIAKPDVLGAIYRVRRQGAPVVADPRGRTLPWNAMTPVDLARLLNDPRPAVQERALRQFAKIGDAAVPALVDVAGRSPSVEARRNAVWALTRIEGARAREAVRAALGDRDDGVRGAAIHSAGLWRDRAAVTPLEAALKSDRPALKRSAAEALGRVGDAGAVPGLLEAAASSASDRVLEHSLTYALIEIGDASSTAAGLQATASGSRRAALIALDQIDGGRLQPAQIIPLLTSSDGVITQTAWWIALRHPEWGSALSEFFAERLTTVAPAERDVLARQLTQFASAPAIQDLLARTAASGTSTAARLAALGAMSGAASTAVPAATRVKELPAAWADAVARALTSADDAVTRQAVSVARAVPAGKGGTATLEGALLRVARDQGRPAEVRVDALSARPAGSIIDAELFALLRSSLEPARPAPLRTAAAAVLQRAALDRQQLLALAALARDGWSARARASSAGVREINR